MLGEAGLWVLRWIEGLGYLGIIALMFVESSFFPFPSEVVIPPAGYLAAQGKMDLLGVILCGTLGSLLGALLNYFLALKLGRPFLDRYGNRLLVSRRTLEKAEGFFDRHGAISTFVGRLLPGIRQYISLPAGFSRMSLVPFCLYTSLGAGIWVTVLALVGYWFGNNQEALREHLREVSLGVILLAAVVVGLYVLHLRRRGKDEG